eukprot:8923631-Pyramimonas_sp.AAC.2
MDDHTSHQVVAVERPCPLLGLRGVLHLRVGIYVEVVAVVGCKVGGGAALVCGAAVPVKDGAQAAAVPVV